MERSPSPPSIASLASVFARYGNSTFGGGTATIIEIERQVVEERFWLSVADSRVAYAVSRLTPGTNLLAYCAGIGWRMRGILGSVVALTAASVPCAIMAVALTRFFSTWSAHPTTHSAMRCALAAAIGILVGTVWTMIRPHVGIRSERVRTLYFAIAAFLLGFAGLAPVRVLLAAAIIGAITTPKKSEA